MEFFCQLSPLDSGIFHVTELFRQKFKFPIREYRQSDQQKLKSQLEILTKTFRKLTINFSPGQVTTVVNKIERLKSAQTVKDLPAFQLGSEPSEEEWDFFSLKKEYEYMGVPNNEWKLTVSILRKKI